MAHPVQKSWHRVMTQLADVMAAQSVHPSRVVVLVPYAQLMQQARIMWATFTASTGRRAAFTPRFETTMNWATHSSATVATERAADDIQLDVAIDVLTASSLLVRAGLATQQNALAGRLVEAAWSLSRLAAAQAPSQRLAWGLQLADALGAGLEPEALALELALARIALAWAAASAYPSDVLFSAQAHSCIDLLVVLEGFQSEPLANALAARFGARTLSLPLVSTDQTSLLDSTQVTRALHNAMDAEDEAQRAAACVLAHLAQGRSPVALVAQDRTLTRRIRSLLAERGVALRDETGWTLSTTRAAAALMVLLRALPWDATADAVLDWLKNAPAFDAAAVIQAEVALRKTGVRVWRARSKTQLDIAAVATQAEPIRAGLQRARSLAHWLHDVRAALQSAGQWAALVVDPAGTAVLQALHLQNRQDSDAAQHPTDMALSARMSLQDFTSWVNQALEAASFVPVHPPQAQVVILPLSQLLGRPVQAVVMPGCDESRLAVSPEPPGLWTPAQRELLGLPSRVALAAAARTAWDYLLCMPHVDLLWRASEAGERLMPSGFVQELLLKKAVAPATDPRLQRARAAQPTPRPQPTGQALPVARLSASAYEDLRRCPYRFFALQQLRLKASDELESELGKRDFGNWLHTLLHHFHEALKQAPRHDLPGRVAMINIAAEQASTELGLSRSEFLPFAAIWPSVRNGYLAWLTAHEASGAQFVEGEVWKDMPLGPVTLIGKLDRIDQRPDGSHLVIDYKTEAPSTTQGRISNAREDTQLAFYAALLADDTLAAAYVNLGEKTATKTHEQVDIVDLRDGLIHSIVSDMTRIAEGAFLPALGEGKACDFCAARGLCRKDFWTV
ncbi:MAG: PD-(D/E)XK nuclease family protein [Polaromonas sp.]|nr:MAG: PD-(D/E)XK nuclease family protein [Polaromonas sp.]